MKALFEVFYRPGVLFSTLAERRAAWVAPLLVNCVLVVLMSFLVQHFVGRENVVRQQFESFKMPPEQMQAAIARSNSAASIYGGYVAAAIIVPLMLLGLSVALWAFSMMTSRAPKFMTMFSMVTIAFFPYWVVSVGMTALILAASPDPSSLDIRNLIATNPAAYMDKNSMAKGLYSLLGSLDILSFAEIGLLSFGFSKLTRVSFFFGLAAVMGLWILYVSSKMALSLLF